MSALSFALRDSSTMLRRNVLHVRRTYIFGDTMSTGMRVAEGAGPSTSRTSSRGS